MKNIRLISSCFILYSMLYSQAGYSMIPMGPQFNIYGGISNPIGTPGMLHISLSPQEVDTLRNQAQNYDIIGGFGIAYDFLKKPTQPDNPIHDVSLGLDFFALNTTLTGDVYQYGSSQLDNFDYYLRLKSTWLLFDGQVNFHPIANGIIPFLKAGMGVARISASYRETPNASQSLSQGDISLPSHTNWNPAYSLGVGLKIPLSQHIQLSTSYHYVDLGPVKTGSAPAASGGETVQPIKMRLRDQSVLIGLSYLFY